MSSSPSKLPNQTVSRQWRVVRVQAPPIAAESAASLVVEATQRGVSWTESGDTTVITGYVYAEQPQTVVNELRLRLAILAQYLGMPKFPVSVTCVCDQDWVGAWQDSYRPLRVGRRLVIKPSWHSWPPQDHALPARADDIVIEMDPQMAFGTGNHPTTQLCLEVVEDLFQPDCSVADVGCGTGILSIAAARLGAGEVYAVDNDPIAVEITRANIVHNAVAECISVALGEGLNDVERKFDMALANINTPTIVKLASSLSAHLNPHGTVVVSGIPTVRADRIASALRQTGLWVEDIRTRANWVCLIGRRRTNRRELQ